MPNDAEMSQANSEYQAALVSEGDEYRTVTEDTTYEVLDVIAIFHKITFVNAEGSLITTDLRIIADENGQYAEYPYTCQNCKTVDWLTLGVSSGEYRCSKCTLWLTPQGG